jgi:hypothetical protein
VDRAASPDGPVPADLRPPLATAARDYPEPYLDGCHVPENGSPSNAPCAYGNPTSPTTIALFGDSHALSWFPAVEGFARREGWRLLDVTMSTCSPADIPIWVPLEQRVESACTVWRAGAIGRLVAARPAILLVAGTRGFETVDAAGNVLTGAARARAWTAGMIHTLDQLVPAAGTVIDIADVPLSRVEPPACLAQNPASILACATPVSLAINASWRETERAAAAQAGALFIDPSLWVCPSSPCPVVIGNVLVYRDTGHLTATFAATLAGRLGDTILAEVGQSRRP